MKTCPERCLLPQMRQTLDTFPQHNKGKANAAQQEAVRGRRVTFIPQDPFTSLNPVFTIGQQIDELLKWKSPRRAPGRSRMPALLTPYPRARRRQDRDP